MPNASHRFTKRAALSAESLSRMPPRWRGCEATIPTGRPPIRARQVMIVRAHFGLRSSHSPSSTISRITSYMSYGLRLESGRTSSSASSQRSTGSVTSRTRRRAARSATGSTTGTRLMRAMHSSSSATSRSPTPDLRQCTRAPPSSSCVTSSPIAARTRCGPASAIEPWPAHHRHEVREPRDVRRARRARAHQRRHLRDDAAHHDLLAEQVAGAGEQRADRLLDPRAGAVEQPDDRDPLGQRELAHAARP